MKTKEKELILKLNIWHHMSWWDRTAYYRARLIDSIQVGAVIAAIVYFVK